MSPWNDLPPHGAGLDASRPPARGVAGTLYGLCRLTSDQDDAAGIKPASIAHVDRFRIARWSVRPGANRLPAGQSAQHPHQAQVQHPRSHSRRSCRAAPPSKPAGQRCCASSDTVHGAGGCCTRSASPRPVGPAHHRTRPPGTPRYPVRPSTSGLSATDLAPTGGCLVGAHRAGNHAPSHALTPARYPRTGPSSDDDFARAVITRPTHRRFGVRVRACRGRLRRYPEIRESARRSKHQALYSGRSSPRPRDCAACCRGHRAAAFRGGVCGSSRPAPDGRTPYRPAEAATRPPPWRRRLGARPKRP